MIRRVGILGFGRFGRAISWLFEEAGLEVRAFDLRADVPAAMRVGSVQELVTASELVMLAVPVHAIRAAIAEISPFLTPSHLVIDVASVKTRPEEALREALGAQIPWVATHPLFGPASLARGDRPMRVVVCNNELHPRAVISVLELYRRIGCEPIEQTAEEHDRVMARTHVLTFFIAKGLLDAGADRPVAFAPPSYQALHRALEAVRIDAGHLFFPIQHENPFAGEERRRLLDALDKVDAEIIAQVRSDDPPSLAIPDLGAPSGELVDVRAQIDAVDRELLECLRRRAQLALRAGQAKAREGKPVRDPERERQLLEARAAWARDNGLDPAAIRALFEAILSHSRSVQRDLGSFEPWPS